MENAANALRIAFGVMIALMLLSLMIYVFNIISTTENDKADQKIIQENVEYNRKFLAFDRTSMYGTDVISVLGLAISSNETAKLEHEYNPDGSYDPLIGNTINIEIRLNAGVTAIKRVYNYTKEYDTSLRKYVVRWIEDESKKEPKEILPAGLHNLSNDSANKITFEKLRKIAVEGNSSIEVKTTGTVRTEIDGSGFNDFKKRIFTCTNISYSQTGRINFMRFEEKDT